MPMYALSPKPTGPDATRTGRTAVIFVSDHDVGAATRHPSRVGSSRTVFGRLRRAESPSPDGDHVSPAHGPVDRDAGDPSAPHGPSRRGSRRLLFQGAKDPARRREAREELRRPRVDVVRVIPPPRVRRPPTVGIPLPGLLEPFQERREPIVEKRAWAFGYARNAGHPRKSRHTGNAGHAGHVRHPRHLSSHERLHRRAARSRTAPQCMPIIRIRLAVAAEPPA